MGRVDYFALAEHAAKMANGFDSQGRNAIHPAYIYAQWAHETGGFASDLCLQYNNLAGLTQESPNSTPQPDGNMYYMQFDSPEEFATYFGRYLRYYAENGIYGVQTVDDYVYALHDGGYFGDDVGNYLAGVHAVYDGLGVA